MENFNKEPHFFELKYGKAMQKGLIRNSCLILSMIILFTSCHGYKKMDLTSNTLEVNKKYKVSTEEYQNKKMIIKNFNDSEIVVLVDEEEVSIPFSEIQEIRIQKFSFFKSFVVLPASYFATGFGLAFLGYGIR